MPLSAEARATNLEKSLVAWIQTTLVAQAGLNVFYDQTPAADRPNEWVHVDFLLGLRTDFGRQLDSTRLGGRVHSLLQLSLAKKRSSLTNLYAMAQMQDAVMDYFQVPQTIPVRDYALPDPPVIGMIIVETVSSVDLDDGVTSGVIVKALSIGLTYTEAYTLA